MLFLVTARKCRDDLEIGMLVVVEIRSQKPFMEILILANRLQNKIEFSTTLCNC
jgi:hypothetical protein